MKSQVPDSPTAGQRPAATPIHPNAHVLHDPHASAHGKTVPGKNHSGMDGKRTFPRLRREVHTQRGIMAVAIACLEEGQDFPDFGLAALALGTTEAAVKIAAYTLGRRGFLVLRGKRILEVRV